MGRKLFIVATLFFIYFLPLQSAYATPAAWLFKDTLVSMVIELFVYLRDNKIDERLAQENKRKLAELVQDLESRLSNSAAADKAEIEKQLQEAQSFLNMLHTLLDSQARSAAEHERRLEKLEKDLISLKKLLGEKGVVVNYPERTAQEAPGTCPRELAVGCRALIVSPGVSQMAIRRDCDSTITNRVRVGQMVRVIEECPDGDRFCIRAEDDKRSLGCARRAQLEPNGSANE